MQKQITGIEIMSEIKTFLVNKEKSLCTYCDALLEDCPIMNYIAENNFTHDYNYRSRMRERKKLPAVDISVSVRRAKNIRAIINDICNNCYQK